MRTKLFTVLTIVLFLFVFAALKAPNVLASTVQVQGWFTNSGVISVNVWYKYFYTGSGGNLVQFYPTSGEATLTVAAGTTGYGFNYSAESTIQTSPWYVQWRSDCTDPLVPINQDASGLFVDPPTFIGMANVTCPAPATGLAASCDASNNLTFSWNSTTSTRYAIRIDDTADGWIGPLDTVDDNVYSTSYTRVGTAGHTYTWWLHTIYNDIWSNQANGPNVTCAAPVNPPPEPTRNAPSQTCNGSNVNATFSWGAVSGATAYRLDIWDPNGVWSANSHEGGGTTGWAYQDTGTSTSWTWWNFPSNSGQTWTARAYANGLWSNIATWDGFTTINCTTPPTPTLTANYSCPFAVLQVQFNWNNVQPQTGYVLEVATDSFFSNRSVANPGTNETSYLWISPNLFGNISLAYNTTYYSRIKAMDGSISGSYSLVASFTTPASSTCANPVVNITLFNDKNGNGIIDAGESFGTGGNPAFSSSFTTLKEVFGGPTVDITANVSANGTVPGRTLAAGQLDQYIVTPGTNWVLTKYSSDKNLSAPACTAGSGCSYATGNPGATGNWMTAVNSVWNLKLGVQATTATLNATVFYDKNGDGIKQAGEDFNLGGNPAFSSSVAAIWEGSNGNNPNPTDKTSSFNTSGGYSRSVLAAQSTYWYQFRVTPAVGWTITKYQSNMSLTTGSLPTCATANSPCNYGSINSAPGYTGWKYPAPSDNLSFLLGVAPMTPANPNAGWSSSTCSGAPNVSLSWTDKATFETGYQVDISTNTAFSPIIGTKTLPANTTSFIWSSTNKLDNTASPAYGTTYYWRVRAINLSVASSNVYPTANGVGTTTAPGVSVATPTLANCTPPADPRMLGAVGSCSNGVLTVNFGFRDDATDESGYYIDVTTGGNATTWPSVWGYKQTGSFNSGVNGGQYVSWSASSPLSAPDADPNTTGNQITPAFGTTYRWRMVAYKTSIYGTLYSQHVYPMSTTSPTGTAFTTPSADSCSPPPSPSNLSVTMTCPSGLPSLQFSWTDNATNDTDYYVDINGAAWTGDSSPSPSGVKTLAGNGATTGTMSWTWSSTAPVDTGGDTNPVTAGSQTTPENNVQYYWRVIARNTSTSPALYSPHVYPNGGAGTTALPGTSVTPRCNPNLVVSVFTIPDGDFGSFQNASVTVANTGLAATSAGFEVAIRINGNGMTCGSYQDFTFTTTALAAGVSRALTIPVTLPSAVGTFTATAMVDSDCAINEVLQANEDDNTLTTTYQAQGFDLSANVVSFNKQRFHEGETVSVTVRIANTAIANKNSPATTVGFWTGQAGEVPLPNCAVPSPQTSPLTPQAVNAGLTPGGVPEDITFTFPAGSLPGTFIANAYVIPTCDLNDVSWANNSTAFPGNVNFTYSVFVDSFFNASGGDVGSQGTISVSRSPQPGQQSNYLVAGTTLTNVQSPWQITNYPSGMRQVPAIVYPYLAEKFKTAAAVVSRCDVGSLQAGGNWCAPGTDVTLSSSAGFPSPASGTAYYWFIEGNLTITGNLSLANNLAMVFIVKGNIVVNTSVTRIDGIYVAGQTFQAETSTSDFVGPQLTVNGAVYTNQSDLSRVLGGGAGVCGSTCNNATDPAIVFNLDPKYMVLLTPTLGTPALGWKEVNP